jgi:hypothetical protein
MRHDSLETKVLGGIVADARDNVPADAAFA